jgi:large subunit ribosomal protein L1
MSQRPKATNMDMSKEEIKTPEEVIAQKAKEKKAAVAKARSKSYVAANAQVDKNKHYNLDEAVELVKKTSYSKFDGTVELHMVVKKQGLSVQVTLPFAGGKTKKIEVADDATLEKLKAGKVDFDVLLATPEMMPKLVVFARILGPKGLMPNPKNGTLIKSVDAAKKYSANATTVKTEKDFPLIHTTAGKVSQPSEEIKQNAEAILSAVNKRVILKAFMKASMGPSIKLAL